MLTNPDQTRLNKYLALHLGLSRRQADDLIASGKVKLNENVAKLGDRVLTGDLVYLNGQVVKPDTKKVCILLNKPAGYVCSRRKQGEKPTIYSLIPPKMHNLKPVGRLDADSSGLILLTNDGDFAQQMTHPSFYKQKIYEIELDKPLEPLHQQMIGEFGITLEDGVSLLKLESLNEVKSRWKVIMTEGRNRQIRRTFGSLGYTVKRLHRTNFGNYTLGDIPAGEYRLVDIR